MRRYVCPRCGNTCRCGKRKPASPTLIFPAAFAVFLVIWGIGEGVRRCCSSRGRWSRHTAPHQRPRSTTTARPLRGQAAIAAMAPTTRFCAPGPNNYGVADPIQIGGSSRVC